ncbi:MAG: PhzF family phenazine biosynthesis protein [Eubacteriales bacterium]|nr:PhzF family phenazine biosynthesis protein [Eubacteriales bacterium]
MKYYIIDAFSDKMFGGNQAGVCVLDHPISADLMQNIAIENRFSETAFLIKRDGYYDLRWFTPGGEIDFCGHATLGSAYVIKQFLEPEIREIHFRALCGELTVVCENDLLNMNAPRWVPEEISVPEGLQEALGAKILYCGKTRDTLILLDSADTVRALQPDISALAKLTDVKCAIVTAPGADSDFVCRVFAPAFGVDEDPVTGSAHSTLIPYWAEKLGKTDLVSHQVSQRGGVLACRDLPADGRVEMAGNAVCYLIGELQLEEEE